MQRSKLVNFKIKSKLKKQQFSSAPLLFNWTLIPPINQNETKSRDLHKIKMMKSDSFYENFDYPKAPQLGPYQLLKRRWGQVNQLLFSEKCDSPESLSQGVNQHYSRPQEVNFYKAYANFGLHLNEGQAFYEVKKNHEEKELPSCLVVGCGAGREVFAIAKERIYSQVLGIDTSAAMIDAAQSIEMPSSVSFRQCGVQEVSGAYDLIWITSILESHIQGRHRRIAFYEEIFTRLKPGGCVIMTPFIRPLHWRNLHFWSSQLLRLRWLGTKQWEPGDVMVANLGSHNIARDLVYSHFYPSKGHFTEELNLAGFTKWLELHNESWVIRK